MPSSSAGGKQVERHDLPLRLRARDPRAVERRRGVPLAQSADEHVACRPARVTPLTRCTAWPASLSGLFAICSAVTALTMLVALRCSSSARFTVPRSASALTEISASCTASADERDVLARPTPPSGTTIPVTTLGPNPIIRTRMDTGPAGTPLEDVAAVDAPSPRSDRLPTTSTVAPGDGRALLAFHHPADDPAGALGGQRESPQERRWQRSKSRVERTVSCGHGSGEGVGWRVVAAGRPWRRRKSTGPVSAVGTEVQRECHGAGVAAIP